MKKIACHFLYSSFLVFGFTDVVYALNNYTKIANDGSTLPDSATLGTKSTDWACTKDNNSGLVWEVKTSDGGLRDSAKTYTNYTPDYPKCDDTSTGEIGGCVKYKVTGKYGDSTNTDSFVTAVNNQFLCGKNDWRLPTNEELKGLVYCSNGKYNTLSKDEAGYICSSNDVLNYTFNTTYFPNTQGDFFWSSSSHASYISGDLTWFIDIDSSSNYGYSGNSYNVRLVR